MFSRHNLQVGNFNWDIVITHNNQITLVLCVLLLLLTIVVISSRRKLSLILRSLFSQRHFSLIQREGKMLKEKNAFALLLFDLMTIATGITMFTSIYIPNFLSKVPCLAKVGIFLGILFVCYFIKLVLCQLYAFLFDRKKEHVLINQYKFVFITDFSIALFPLLILIEYAKLNFLFYAITVILAILFGVWIYRLGKINPPNGKIFHFFLYFCTLEILPWLIFVKFMLKF